MCLCLKVRSFWGVYGCGKVYIQGDGPDLTLTPISRCSRGYRGTTCVGATCATGVLLSKHRSILPKWALFGGRFWAVLVSIVKTGHFNQQLRARSSVCCFWGFKRVIYGNNYARVVLFDESHKCLDKGL